MHRFFQHAFTILLDPNFPMASNIGRHVDSSVAMDEDSPKDPDARRERLSRLTRD